MKEKQVSLSTYIQMVCALRFFFTHTLSRKIAIERIPFPRREPKLPMILSREEVNALLEAPRTLSHRALLAVLYGCGVRVPTVNTELAFRTFTSGARMYEFEIFRTSFIWGPRIKY